MYWLGRLAAVTATYSFDAAGRMTAQHLWSQSSPAQNDVLNQFTLDPDGRLTGLNSTVTPPAPGLPATLSLGYGYDANGNRTNATQNTAQTAYAYSANRLTGETGATLRSYQYDAAGRMTSDGQYTYSYDPFGRLAGIAGSSGTIASYRYNALGQRIAKDGLGTTGPTQTTLFQDAFAEPDGTPIDDQDDNLWTGGGKKNTVAYVQSDQAVINPTKEIKSKSAYPENGGLTFTATLVRGRAGLFSSDSTLMVKYDGIDTITVTADDGDDIDDPGKAKFKATKSRLPLAVTVTEKQGVGRAKIVSGSDSFDSGDIPMIAGESWHIRLGAIKVKSNW